ncbi:MAG: 4Fe-4S cluster-binding domain-containing protein [Candidatus Cryptobacteroides sp.]
MRLFDIQHFCTHDGPGIRTTVFFKGCPLRCRWCHNPESQSPDTQVFFNSTRCVGCGACGGNHHDNPQVCLYGGMEACGFSAAVDEVMEEVLRDESYYRHSGGGMTLSGGEPMAQADEALELLSKARSLGIHTAMETSGCGKLEDYLKAVSFTDLFIWDVKLMDPELYRHYTGGNLETTLGNLDRVASTGASLLLRVLFIPEIHSDEQIIRATEQLLAKYPGARKEVIPYHLLGNSKRQKLGLREIRFREPSPEELEAFRSRLMNLQEESEQ